MINAKVFAIFCMCLNIVLCASDCGTPVECYIKAIDLLQKARDEYRTNYDKLVNSTREMENFYISELSKKETSFQTQLENSKNNLMGEIDGLKNELNAVKSEMSTIVRYGGGYQVDDCGRDNVANPLGGGLGCPSGYHQANTGRIKAPESYCGANQYICVK